MNQIEKAIDTKVELNVEPHLKKAKSSIWIIGYKEHRAVSAHSRNLNRNFGAAGQAF
jgi:hypothetical protein